VSTKSVNVLVVDDESAISEMIRFALKRAGMNVRIAADAREALVCISEQKPDIILMDWMMPGVSGVELTRRLRRDPVTSEIPVIMLTAKVTEDDKVTGLNAGSDDYIVKPFSPRELVARIQAVLRRSSAADDDGLIRVGKLTMNTLTRVASGNSVEIRLGPTEYRLLEFFMTHPGRSYSRSQLLDHVWGTGVYLEERTVDVHIKRLRKAMDVAGLRQYLQTVRGHGYRLMAVD
jgi:two-component system phosphate regulon response regulator PhoB